MQKVLEDLYQGRFRVSIDDRILDKMVTHQRITGFRLNLSLLIIGAAVVFAVTVAPYEFEIGGIRSYRLSHLF